MSSLKKKKKKISFVFDFFAYMQNLIQDIPEKFGAILFF